MKSIFTNKVNLLQILIVSIITYLIYDFEKGKMYSSATEIVSTSSANFPFLIFGILLLYCILNSRQIMQAKDSKYFLLLTIWSYIIFIFTGSIESRVTYVIMLLPGVTYFAIKKYYDSIEKKNFILFVVSILLIGLAYYYFKNYYSVLSHDIGKRNNASYTLLYLLPFVLCIPKSVYKYLLAAVIGIAIFVSFKRGGLLAYFCSLAIYQIISLLVEEKSGKFKQIITIIVLFFALYYGFSQIADSNSLGFAERFRDIDNDESRFIIYSTVLNMLKESNLIEFIFGHGWDGVYLNSPLGFSAHNDFLEALYDCGLIGFIALMYYFVFLIKSTVRMISDKSENAAPMAASLGLFTINCMVSHIWFYPHNWLLMAAFWGVILSDENLKEKNINIYRI